MARVTVSTEAETVTLADGAVAPVRYVVTSSTGYRAVLPACRHEDGRAACPLPRGHAKSAKGATLGCDGRNGRACHGWHRESAERFAKEVLDTYGCARKRKRGDVVGVKRGSLPAKDFAPVAA